MNALLAKWCTLTDELIKKRLVKSLEVGRSTTDAETKLAVIQLTLSLYQGGFIADFIDDLDDAREDEGERSEVDAAGPNF